MAAAWTVALNDLGADHPPWVVLWLLCFIWFNCVDTLWRARNNILRHHKNEHDLMVDSRNSDTLHWFLNNSEALNPRDRYSLTFSPADIPLMAPRTKHELVRLLTTARDLHSTESAS
jgi:hypothetical protein